MIATHRTTRQDIMLLMGRRRGSLLWFVRMVDAIRRRAEARKNAMARTHLWGRSIPSSNAQAKKLTAYEPPMAKMARDGCMHPQSSSQKTNRHAYPRPQPTDAAPIASSRIGLVAWPMGIAAISIAETAKHRSDRRIGNPILIRGPLCRT